MERKGGKEGNEAYGLIDTTTKNRIIIHFASLMHNQSPFIFLSFNRIIKNSPQ
jgi:hypothetical protein